MQSNNLNLKIPNEFRFLVNHHNSVTLSINDILSRKVAAGMQPVTSANGDMTEHTLNGIVVHLDATVQKELLKGFFVIQDIIDCPVDRKNPSRYKKKEAVAKTTEGNLHSLSSAITL